MNFAREVLQAQPPQRRALVELGRDGTRREWSFGEMRQLIEAAAETLAARGVARGEVVMTLLGNRVEWVASMMACFWNGAVVLPCTEQLRAKDLRLRLEVARPQLIVTDERNREELEAAAPDCPVLWIPDRDALFAGRPGQAPPAAPTAHDLHARQPPHLHARQSPHLPAQQPPHDLHAGQFLQGPPLHEQGPPAHDLSARRSPQGPPLHGAIELDEDDPALITFTSGTAGEPKAVVHGQRYLHGQRLQARDWLGAQPGQLVWCTAASGWSKSARNVFIAPWLSGAAALLHDARFDPHERLETIER